MACPDRKCKQLFQAKRLGGLNDAYKLTFVCSTVFVLLLLLSTSRSFAGSVAYVPWEYQADDYSRIRNELLVIDMSQGLILKRVVLDYPANAERAYVGYSHSVAVLPSGDRVWVENRYRGGIDVYDSSSMERIHHIPLAGQVITYLAPDPRGGTVYAASYQAPGGYSILEFDSNTMTARRNISLPEYIIKIGVDIHNNRLLVTHNAQYQGSGVWNTPVSFLDLDAYQVITRNLSFPIGKTALDGTGSNVFAEIHSDICILNAESFVSEACDIEPYLPGMGGWILDFHRATAVIASANIYGVSFLNSQDLGYLGSYTVFSSGDALGGGLRGFAFSLDGRRAIVLPESQSPCGWTPPCNPDEHYYAQTNFRIIDVPSGQSLFRNNWGRGTARVKGHHFVGPNLLHAGETHAVPTFTTIGTGMLSTLVLLIFLMALRERRGGVSRSRTW